MAAAGPTADGLRTVCRCPARLPGLHREGVALARDVAATVLDVSWPIPAAFGPLAHHLGDRLPWCKPDLSL
jgi:hypothetical protein